VKSNPGDITVSAYIAGCKFPPPSHAIVIVYVPLGVVEEVDMVMALVNVGRPEDGLKFTVTPLG